jgi:predicted N-acetyltransferase YhbS
MTVHIRAETPADFAAIHALTRRAFAPMPFAAGDEQDVPKRLRDTGRLALSLVADGDGAVIGHAAFSRMLHSGALTAWFALGPVSVVPEQQKIGIGGRLIREGLAILRERGALGCCLTGDPRYYQRFGFAPAPDFAPPNEPAQFFQMLRFTDAMPPKPLEFDSAFYG